MIQLLNFKKKRKPKPNQDFLKAFQGRTAPANDGGAQVEVVARWGANMPLDQKPIIHGANGEPVLGGKKEIAQKAQKVQHAVMAMIGEDMRLPQLLAFVKNTATESEREFERIKQIEDAIIAIMVGMEPDLEE